METPTRESSGQESRLMTPLDLSQKDSIVRRLDFMRVELADAAEYVDLNYELYSTDRQVRRNIERIIENVGNCTIDIAKTFLAGEPVELPATYREALLKLGELGIIPPSLAEQMAEIARAGNVPAHQYLDIKWQLVKDFIDTGVVAAESFTELVSSRLEL